MFFSSSKFAVHNLAGMLSRQLADFPTPTKTKVTNSFWDSDQTSHTKPAIPTQENPEMLVSYQIYELESRKTFEQSTGETMNCKTLQRE